MAIRNKNAYKWPNLVQVFIQHKSIPKESSPQNDPTKCSRIYKINFRKCQSLLSSQLLFFKAERKRRVQKKRILIFNLIGRKRRKKNFQLGSNKIKAIFRTNCWYIFFIFKTNISSFNQTIQINLIHPRGISCVSRSF